MERAITITDDDGTCYYATTKVAWGKRYYSCDIESDVWRRTRREALAAAKAIGRAWPVKPTHPGEPS